MPAKDKEQKKKSVDQSGICIFNENKWNGKKNKPPIYACMNWLNPLSYSFYVVL